MSTFGDRTQCDADLGRCGIEIDPDVQLNQRKSDVHHRQRGHVTHDGDTVDVLDLRKDGVHHERYDQEYGGHNHKVPVDVDVRRVFNCWREADHCRPLHGPM